MVLVYTGNSFLQVVESHKLQWRAESKVTNDHEDLKMDDDNEDDNEGDDEDEVSRRFVRKTFCQDRLIDILSRPFYSAKLT